MKLFLLTLTLLVAGNLALAEENPATKICKVAVTKSADKNLTSEQAKAFGECVADVTTNTQKCLDGFSAKIKGFDTTKKEGLLSTFEEQKKLMSCNMDVSINVIKKYY